MQIRRFRWFLVLLIAMSLVYIAIPTFAAENKPSEGQPL